MMAHAIEQHLKQPAFLATCSLELAQQSTWEAPTMPVMKMARLKLNIEQISTTTAQHFILAMSLSTSDMAKMRNG